MDPAHEKLLEALEELEADLEGEEILKKVKQEWVLDDGVTAFGDKLKEREHMKQAAQATRTARATRFHPLRLVRGGVGLLLRLLALSI